MSRLLVSFLHPDFQSISEKGMRARLTFMYALLGLLFSLFYFTIHPYFGLQVPRIKLLIDVFLALTVVLSLRYYPKLDFSAHLLILLYWLSYTTSSYFAGGIYSFVVPWLTLIPVMGRMLLPAISSVFWLFMPLLTISMMSFLNYFQGIPPWRPMVANMGLLFILYLIIWIYDQAQFQLRKTILDNNIELEKQRNTIYELNSRLKEKLDEMLRRNQKMNSYWMSLVEISKSKIFNSLGVEFAIKYICKNASSVMLSHRVSVWRYNAETFNMSCLMLWDEELNDFVTEPDINGKMVPLYLEALGKQTLIIADDARNFSLTREFRDEYLIPRAIYSMLDAPYFIDGKMAGVICFEHKHEIRNWLAEDVLYAQALADMISLVIRNTERRRFAQKIKMQKLALSKQNSGLINELRDRNEDLSIRNQQLSEYSYINSHMMRAPLCRMLGLMNLLEKELETGESKQLIEYMMKAGKELDQITRRINLIVDTGSNFDREHLRSY